MKKLFAVLGIAALALSAAVGVSADTAGTFRDDFENISVPPPEYTLGANLTASVANTPAVSGSNSLKLVSTAAANIARSVESDELILIETNVQRSASQSFRVQGVFTNGVSDAQNTKELITWLNDGRGVYGRNAATGGAYFFAAVTGGTAADPSFRFNALNEWVNLKVLLDIPNGKFYFFVNNREADYLISGAGAGQGFVPLTAEDKRLVKVQFEVSGAAAMHIDDCAAESLADSIEYKIGALPSAANAADLAKTDEIDLLVNAFIRAEHTASEISNYAAFEAFKDAIAAAESYGFGPDLYDNALGVPLHLLYNNLGGVKDALTEIKIDGTPLIAGYEIKDGRILLDASHFPTAKDYAVTISDGAGHNWAFTQPVIPTEAKVIAVGMTDPTASKPLEFEKEGAWVFGSSGLSGWDGGQHTAYASGGTVNSFTWKLRLNSISNFSVDVCNVKHMGNTTFLNVAITGANGVTTKTFGHNNPSSSDRETLWESAGVFPFSDAGAVRLYTNLGGMIRADAIRLAYSFSDLSFVENGFYNADGAALGVSGPADECLAKATVSNNTDSEKSMKAILAVYRDGALKDVQVHDLLVPAKDVGRFGEFVALASGESVRLFLWRDLDGGIQSATACAVYNALSPA
jgi:hypothetical protein